MTIRSTLESPSSRGRREFLAAVGRSRRLHRPWVAPPRTAAAFDAHVRHAQGPACIGYWVRTREGELAGVINITEVVRGAFQSAYLGYYAFVPHNGRGHMRRGLSAAIREAFGTHRLHRLEANIQPGNELSRRLVRGLGFRLEGFSLKYLKVGGRWRDHERWALTVDDWRAHARAGDRRVRATHVGA